MLYADTILDRADMVDVKVPAERSRVGKPKVKTGCKTCKIRRIKCDEAKPSCKRCTSTGRTCDGYAKPSDGKKAQPKANRLLDYHGTPLEHYYLSFFRHYTAPLLSTPFDSHFWTSLLLRVAHAEPTLQHAMISVASIHEQVELASFTACRRKNSTIDSSSCYFAIQQYNKAISCLKDRLSSGPQSEEVTLMCCVLFICLEFLRGNVDTAIAHLNAGLGIMAAWNGKLTSNSKSQSRCELSRDQSLPTDREPDEIPDNLSQMFSRLSIQSMLCGQPPPFGRPLPAISPSSPPIIPPVFFANLQSARTTLDALMKTSLEFLREAYGFGCVLLDEAKRRLYYIMNALRKWEVAFDLFLVSEGRRERTREERAAANLRILNIVARIWLPSAESAEQSVFDRQTDAFWTIIGLAQTMDEGGGGKSLNSSTKMSIKGSTQPSTFAFEMGIIPPLYFVAMKCRVPSIRRSAISLLEITMPRREGIWVADLYIAVARRVIEIEEQDLELTGIRDGKTGELLPMESKRVCDAVFRSRAEEDLAERVQRITFVSMPKGPAGKVESWLEVVLW